VTTDVPATDAVIDLVGVLAYGELSAFDQMSVDARMAPTLALRASMADFAAVEMGHYRQIAARLVELGADPEKAMAPFVSAIDTFHERTTPSTWGEALVKAYIGEGLAGDFYREIAEFVDESTRSLVLAALADAGQSAFAVREVHALIDDDTRAASRLSLWGRRMVGEAISQTQHVAAERDSLLMLVLGGTGDLIGLQRLIERILERHTTRMTELGLSN